MKTSPSQFELLVSFMETHGYINKPTKSAQGRMKTIKEWENLANLLNSDATGESKTTEKWKKVWSDLKNNIKKKAAKIHKAASGTGGGPALNIKLTDLDERVLNIIGPQSATGLTGVIEAGLPSGVENSSDSDRTLTLPPSSPHESHSIILTVPDLGSENVIVQDWMLPGTSHQPHIPPPAYVSPPPMPSPPPPPIPQIRTPPATQDLPASRGQTPRRRRGSPLRRQDNSRRRIAASQSHLEQATQQFVHSDETWRNFLIKKHADEMEVEREKLRVRVLEVESQQRWQDVALHAIAVMDKFINSKQNNELYYKFIFIIYCFVGIDKFICSFYFYCR